MKLRRRTDICRKTGDVYIIWRFAVASDDIRLDEIKRKLRELKKLELKIRFNGVKPPGRSLVWDRFFDLRESGTGKARYSLRELASMDHESYREVINDFFSLVYYEFYRENGLAGIRKIYDPDLLSKLGLMFDADQDDIKRRFRELAKKYHPDVGGDAAMFIELMENYRKLMGDGR
jgi:hypothetical protein